MKKRFSTLTFVIAVLAAILITFQVTFVSCYFAYGRNKGKSSSLIGGLDMLNSVDYVYSNYYYGDIDKEELEEGLIYGYLYGTGDKYGEYMDAESYARFTDDSNGKNVGIGVTVIYDDTAEAIEIVSVIPDSPAEKAGVLTGDHIVKVGGESVGELGYYSALSKMQGEAGTKAEFTISRDGEETEFSCVREEITQNTAVGRMHSDGETGIVRIEEFDAATFKQFKSAVKELREKGAVRFVFDVRGNPGGDLESIVSVLDYLLPEGPIIRIEDKDGNETVRESDEKQLDMPMAVLVNENTASAAELFASALQDYEKAVLVGKTTYGKGSMQSVIPLNDGAALRLTIKMYKPPFSESYDGVGVVPDIDVDMAEEYENTSLYKLTDETDTQLIRAIEYFNTGK
ncbi:MAG: S41 family peptidase [Ruminococcaceae bacterium]|nr:S41 family peptidase [Oscillospiraceae bacterium]